MRSFTTQTEAPQKCVTSMTGAWDKPGTFWFAWSRFCHGHFISPLLLTHNAGIYLSCCCQRRLPAHNPPPPINCTWQSWICLSLSLVSWNPAVGSHTLGPYKTKQYLLGLEQTTWHPAKPQTCELREYIYSTTLMIWDHLLHTRIVAMNYWFNLLHPKVYILQPHEAGPQEIGKLSYGCMMLLAQVLGPNTILVRSYCFLQSSKMRKS